MLRIFDIFFKFLSLGMLFNEHQFEMVTSETPNSFASHFCFRPLLFRSSLSCIALIKIKVLKNRMYEIILGITTGLTR